jgi:PKD repeat protein/peptidoglycan/xylan/chitin deacetylase (PgdA/CDA1 family)
VPLAVTFTDTSTAGSVPITSWLWDFGDTNTSTSQNPTHSYTTPGLYTVTLTVDNGTVADTHTKTDLITADPVPPTVDFTATPTTGVEDLAVTFTDTTVAGTGTISTWSWDFGDTNTSTLQNPSHTYIDYGTYTVTLTVTTQYGTYPGSKTDFITVTPEILTLTVATVGGGSVSPASGTYERGTEVLLTATPNTGNAFSDWTTSCSVVSGGGTEENLTVRMDDDCTVTANFGTGVVFTPSIATGEGSLTGDFIRSDGNYPTGTVLTVTTEPAAGWLFERWETNGTIQTGDLLTPVISMLLNTDTTLTAHFVASYSVPPLVSGGTGTVAGLPDAPSYLAGAQVSYTVTPDAGYAFDHWEVSGGLVLADGAVNPASVTVNGDGVLTACLTPIMYTFTATATGSGTVTPASGSYAYGTVLNLDAVPDGTWYFAEWTGDAPGYTAQQNVTITGDTTVAATFVQSLALTVTVAGSGAVTGALGSYLPGDNVTLTATPDPGWRFDLWSGDVAESLNPVSFTIHRDTSVTATFIQDTELTAAVVGQGTVSPASGTYAPGAQVVLTATPDPGWFFNHWEDGVRDLGNPVTITMPLTGPATAVFLPLHTVTVLTVGDGTVDIYAHGDYLTPDVNGDYLIAYGTDLIFFPAGGMGSAFARWQATVSLWGNGNQPASWSVDADATVVAFFAENGTVTVEMEGNGSVTLNPTQPAEGYAKGTVVQVTAVADPDWAFERWTGNQVRKYQASSTSMTVRSGINTLGARFASRAGLDALALGDDLAQFLVDIGHNTTLAEVWSFDFDTGEVDKDGGVVTALLPNNFPDLAELSLLEAILKDDSFNYATRNGASHAKIWAKWAQNVTQAETALGTSVPAHWKRLTAAYMCLGDFGLRDVMPYYLLQEYAIVLEDDGFDLFGKRYFDDEGNVDNDMTWNVEEWEAAVADNAGVMDAQALADFLDYAMDHAQDPRKAARGAKKVSAAEPVSKTTYTVPAAVLALYPDATFDSSKDWSWLEYVPSGMVTVSSAGLEVDMGILEPAGLYDTVPGPDVAFRVPLGAEIRVGAVVGEDEIFKAWSSPDTLIDGGAEASATFRLSTEEEEEHLLTVVATEYARTKLYMPDYATASVGSSGGPVGDPPYIWVPYGESASLAWTGEVPPPSSPPKVYAFGSWGIHGGETTEEEELSYNPYYLGGGITLGLSSCKYVAPGEVDHGWSHEDFLECMDSLDSDPIELWGHSVSTSGSGEAYGAREQHDSNDSGHRPGGIDDTIVTSDTLYLRDKIYANADMGPQDQGDTVTINGVEECNDDAQLEIDVTKTTGKLNINFGLIDKPSIDVDPVQAGHFTGGVVGSSVGLTAYNSAVSECRLTTELVQISACTHCGFDFKEWKGEGDRYDAEGNVLGPIEGWTEPTIIVQCVEGGGGAKAAGGLKPKNQKPKMVVKQKVVKVALTFDDGPAGYHTYKYWAEDGTVCTDNSKPIRYDSNNQPDFLDPWEHLKEDGTWGTEGMTPRTRSVLEILEKEDIPATFFVATHRRAFPHGGNEREGIKLIREAQEKGHVIGHHGGHGPIDPCVLECNAHPPYYPARLDAPAYSMNKNGRVQGCNKPDGSSKPYYILSSGSIVLDSDEDYSHTPSPTNGLAADFLAAQKRFAAIGLPALKFVRPPTFSADEDEYSLIDNAPFSFICSTNEGVTETGVSAWAKYRCNVDPDDYDGGDVNAKLVNAMNTALLAGDTTLVILFHDGVKTTWQHLPTYINTIRKTLCNHSIKWVTLDEL